MFLNCSGDWPSLLPELLGSSRPALGGRHPRRPTPREGKRGGAANEAAALHGAEAGRDEGVQQGLSRTQMDVAFFSLDFSEGQRNAQDEEKIEFFLYNPPSLESFCAAFFVLRHIFCFE